MLSIVVPTLDAKPHLERALAAVAGERLVGEVIVADGGSSDGTPETARRLGMRVIEAPRGRGPQLAAGARAAAGDWLLFLHADTLLAAGWSAAAAAFISDPSNAERAAVFRFALDDSRPAARRLERVVAWRTRVFGLPYGDQGLLIARGFYDLLGGYSAIPLMEDVDLVRRIGRRRLMQLDVAAVTSAERYLRDGYLRRGARNLFCLGLYFLRIPPATILRIYR